MLKQVPPPPCPQDKLSFEQLDQFLLDCAGPIRMQHLCLQAHGLLTAQSVALSISRHGIFATFCCLII